MPPHVFFGFTIDEWVGILGIIGTVYGFLVRPLIKRIANLGNSIDELNKNSITEHNRLWRHYDVHDRKLYKHDIEIGELYSHAHLKREDYGIHEDKNNEN